MQIGSASRFGLFFLLNIVIASVYSNYKVIVRVVGSATRCTRPSFAAYFRSVKDREYEFI